MVILLAGLQAIPETLNEAAVLDGATPFQRLRRVTLPLLTPSLFFVLVISLINGFQVFDQVWVMTGGGPVGSSTVVGGADREEHVQLRPGRLRVGPEHGAVRDHPHRHRCATAASETVGVLCLSRITDDVCHHLSRTASRYLVLLAGAGSDDRPIRLDGRRIAEDRPQHSADPHQRCFPSPGDWRELRTGWSMRSRSGGSRSTASACRSPPHCCSYSSPARLPIASRA